MNNTIQLVEFNLDDMRYAVHLFSVERIVNMVEITPLPKAPKIVIGVVNFEGTIIPVVDIRKRFRLPKKDIELSDLLVIAHTPQRMVIFIADSVSNVIECPEQEIIAAKNILENMEYIEGIIKFKDGLTLIHNLDSFLSIEEEMLLDDAIIQSGEEK